VHVRQLGCPRDGLERDLQLGQDDGGPGEERLVRVEIGRRQAHVAAGGDDDGVLAAGVHGDDGDAGGGLVVRQQPVEADAVADQARGEALAEGVGAHLAEELDAPAEPGAGDGLVGALPTRERLEVAAEDGLAGPGEALARHHHVHVGAADDEHPAPPRTRVVLCVVQHDAVVQPSST